MSVSFNRPQLITVANKALAEHEKAQRAYRAAYQEFLAKHAEAAIEPTRARATSLRDGLTKALKRGGPITSVEIRKLVDGRYRVDEAFYDPPHDSDVRRQVTKPTGLLTPAEMVETQTLLKVLHAATGDTVSANELKLLGLKNLQPIFAAAAAKSA